jgi:hypothetical protein
MAVQKICMRTKSKNGGWMICWARRGYVTVLVLDSTRSTMNEATKAGMAVQEMHENKVKCGGWMIC